MWDQQTVSSFSSIDYIQYDFIWIYFLVWFWYTIFDVCNYTVCSAPRHKLRDGICILRTFLNIYFTFLHFQFSLYEDNISYPYLQSAYLRAPIPCASVSWNLYLWDPSDQQTHLLCFINKYSVSLPSILIYHARPIKSASFMLIIYFYLLFS